MATELHECKDLAELHERDFYSWAKHQAEALRAFQTTRTKSPLDLEHQIEEVDDLADAKLGVVKRQIRCQIVHYLKLEHCRHGRRDGNGKSRLSMRRTRLTTT